MDIWAVSCGCRLDMLMMDRQGWGHRGTGWGVDIVYPLHTSHITKGPSRRLIMKVKDLIEKLKLLDQDKEIKTVVASGYEYEEQTSSVINIDTYESTRKSWRDGTTYFDIDNEDDNTDFYLIK